jgi:tricorn protease
MLIRTKRLILNLLVAALLITCGVVMVFAEAATAETRGYLRYPDLNGEMVVFSSSGDLWLTSLAGGVANRITSHEGDERYAKFSPDGKWIAFSGEYYGNQDVYIIPASGGQPRQLTYHRASDKVVGWDKEGNIIFMSDRTPPRRARELYKVDVDGGYPIKLPIYQGAQISYEPNGSRVALVEMDNGFHVWNKYKGGQAEKIWIGDMSVPEFSLVSHYSGNESFPMWHEDGKIFFVMDSLGRENLWSMNPDGSNLLVETELEWFDLRWPSMNGDKIIFQYGMDLSIFNINTKEVDSIDIIVPTDLYIARTKFIDPEDYLNDWWLSSDGSQLVVDSRGEVFTLPVKGEGLIRQWTYSSGSREKNSEILPESDGAIITVSDAIGEERFVKIDKAGGEATFIEKSPLDDWKYSFHISPDGKYLAYADGSQKLYLIDIEKGSRKEIAEANWEFYEYVWSPDSRYLAYVSESGEEQSSSLYIYDTKKDKSHLVSDPYFSTYSPSWDPAGRFLYCVTDRNFNPYQDYGRGLFLYDNMSTLALIRLREDVISPFISEGDKADGSIPTASWMPEKEAEEESEDDEDAITPIEIDFKNITDRFVHIPEQAGSYGDITAIEDKFYFVQYSNRGMGGNDSRDNNGSVLRLYDLADASSEEVETRISSYQVSGDGSTIVIRKGGSWSWGSGTSVDNSVSTSGWELEVTPSEEWGQIVREAWRQQREFFYDPAMHTIDWDGVFERFAPFVNRMTTREDLQDLIREMQAELNVGHAYIGSGDEPSIESARVGVLGVDMVADHKSGFYKITRVLNPEPGSEYGSSPFVHADPQTKAGTYILAINGRKVDSKQHIGRLLQNQAGKVIAVTLNEKPSFEGSREVLIETRYSDSTLRHLDWIHATREYVSKKSDGKIGYLYLSDMSSPGMKEFGRDYYPQRKKQAIIIDDRWNGGGNTSEMIMKEMTTPIFAQQSSRYGGNETKPHGAYFGHVAVLINGETASDGETMAYNTTLIDDWHSIGERTWGGWIWIWPRRQLLDGAVVCVPEFGGWNNNGEWIIEGLGVSPETEVINNPAMLIKGVDEQLDYSIEKMLEEIEKDPRILPDTPTVGPFGR